MRDVFPALVLARLCVFTPLLLILLVSVSPRWSAHLRESLSATVAVLAVSLPTVIMVFSASPHNLSYQYGSLLIMTFATVIQRDRFRYGGTATLTIMVVQSVTTYLSGAFTAETYVANVVFFVTATILLLLAAYLLEHGGPAQLSLRPARSPAADGAREERLHRSAHRLVEPAPPR